MIETKRSIILDEGVPVEVIDTTGTVLYTTNTLLGKATKQFFSEISLEYHRKAQFVPELDIQNGYLVRNMVTDDYYLIMANLEEVIGNQKSATIARLLECNSSITIKSLVETADDAGNIKKQEVVKVDNLKVYVETVRADLKQYSPGLHPEVEYNIYAPAMEVNLLDKLTLTINGVQVPFKVKSVDYVSFAGIVIIGVASETRK